MTAVINVNYILKDAKKKKKLLTKDWSTVQNIWGSEFVSLSPSLTANLEIRYIDVNFKLRMAVAMPVYAHGNATCFKNSHDRS